MCKFFSFGRLIIESGLDHCIIVVKETKKNMHIHIPNSKPLSPLFTIKGIYPVAKLLLIYYYRGWMLCNFTISINKLNDMLIASLLVHPVFQGIFQEYYHTHTSKRSTTKVSYSLAMQ